MKFLAWGSKMMSREKSLGLHWLELHETAYAKCWHILNFNKLFLCLLLLSAGARDLATNGGHTQLYIRWNKVKAKIFKMPIYPSISTWYGLIWVLDKIFFCLDWIWSIFIQKIEVQNFLIFSNLHFFDTKSKIWGKP